MLFAEELSILDPVVQYIFAGLFLIAFGVIVWMLKVLFKERNNDFEHIKKVLDDLPCDKRGVQIDRLLNDVKSLTEKRE